MGLKWPVEIKTIMSQMPVVPDLLLIRFDPSVPVNMYQRGVVGMLYLDHLAIMAHEVCHAHQHAHIQPRGYIDWTTFWDGSPEGEAYLTARQADWGEVGKNEFDLWKWTSSPLEGAAETCASWWGNRYLAE